MRKRVPIQDSTQDLLLCTVPKFLSVPYFKWCLSLSIELGLSFLLHVVQRFCKPPPPPTPSIFFHDLTVAALVLESGCDIVFILSCPCLLY